MNIKVQSLTIANAGAITQHEEQVMSNVTNRNRKSKRDERSKYSAQCAVSNGRQMITLHEARMNSRASTKEAAEAAGITVRTLKRWEIDCERADTFAMGRLAKYYGISLDHIFPGKAADLVEARIKAEPQVIKLEDVVVALKRMGRDTRELELFLEELDKSWEDKAKTPHSAPTPETFNQSAM